VIAWAVCALTVAVALASLVLAIVDPNVGGPAHVSASGPTPQDEPEGGYVPYAALSALVFSAFALVGAIVEIRRPRNPVGWCFGAGALLWSLGVLSSGLYWHMAFGRANPPVAADYVAWLGTWTFLPAFVLLLALVPLLFPTGAPPSPRWRKCVPVARGGVRRGLRRVAGGGRERAAGDTNRAGEAQASHFVLVRGVRTDVDSGPSACRFLSFRLTDVE